MSPVRLFATDYVLYINIKFFSDYQILQDDLNSLVQWETDWQMKFNVAKCQSMEVTRYMYPPNNQIHFNYSPHQQTLVQVQSTKYLGITMQDNSERDQHVSEISSKPSLWRNSALAPGTWAYTDICLPNIGSPSARVCSSYLASLMILSQNWLRKVTSWTNLSGHPRGLHDEVFINFPLQDSRRYSSVIWM